MANNIIACRKSFTDTLLELARQDKDIVAVTTDARGSVTLGDFAKELPAQFVECGIAEQDAVGISAGLSHSGKKVFVCGPACFYVARSLEGSPYAGKIKFYIGDALKLLPGMNITFDLAFVDGDKRKYIEYYEMVLEKLSPGGYIIADNTLWDGHVLEEPHHTDLQTIGIKKFNDLVAADKRVEKVILPLRDGLTIIRKC